MPRQADGHAGQAGGHDGGDGGFLWQHQGEGAGPEFFGEAERGVVGLGELGELCEGVDVHDERILRWPALGAEYFFAGPRVECMGGQPVNGFGRHRDEFAGAQGAVRGMPSCAACRGRKAGGGKSVVVHGAKKAGAKNSGR